MKDNKDSKKMSNSTRLAIFMVMGACLGMLIGAAFINTVDGGMSLGYGSLAGMIIGIIAAMLHKKKK